MIHIRHLIIFQFHPLPTAIFILVSDLSLVYARQSPSLHHPVPFSILLSLILSRNLTLLIAGKILKFHWIRTNNVVDKINAVDSYVFSEINNESCLYVHVRTRVCMCVFYLMPNI
jgi:hypothetical protein